MTAASDLIPAVAIAASYALGSFSPGYYLVRWRTGRDIRTLGSGSTGGTNVGRVLGAPGFVATLLGDLAKGALAAWAATHLDLRPWGVVLVAVAVVVGHMYPMQLGFRGGKGLATAFGVLLVVDSRVAVVILALAALLAIVSGQRTLSLMVVVAIAPVLTAVMGHTPIQSVGWAVIALLILGAHRTNILTAVRRLRGEAGAS